MTTSKHTPTQALECEAVTEDIYLSTCAERVFVPQSVMMEPDFGEVIVNGELYLTAACGDQRKMSHKLLTQLFLEARFRAESLQDELDALLEDSEDEGEEPQVCQCPDCTAERMEEAKASTKH